jgi:hypothetical protein
MKPQTSARAEPLQQKRFAPSSVSGGAGYLNWVAQAIRTSTQRAYLEGNGATAVSRMTVHGAVWWRQMNCERDTTNRATYRKPGLQHELRRAKGGTLRMPPIGKNRTNILGHLSSVIARRGAKLRMV